MCSTIGVIIFIIGYRIIKKTWETHGSHWDLLAEIGGQEKHYWKMVNIPYELWSLLMVNNH